MAKNYVTSFRGENYYTPTGKVVVKDEPETPIEEDFDGHNLDYSLEGELGMRKSLSMNDIAALREDLMSLDLQNNKDEVYQRYRRPTVGPQELSKTKFVSMAEAVYHYQRDTPGRFHTSRPQTFRFQSGMGPSGLTVPHSPMLRCKARSRPMHIMSQKEKEEMEIEEIKKFKIKANPVPKSVLEGSKNLPDVTKKPVTIPEPFKLTEIHKKAVESPDKIQFKARPAPKHILEKAHFPPKPSVQVTKPVSPKFHYKRANSVDRIKPDCKLHAPHRPIQKSAEKPAPQRHGPIRPEPFSFEQRDELMKKRREERIKQQIEEERKQATMFKAQPLPGGVRRRMQSTTAKASSSTSSENKENHIKFEARPPLVLYKEPFKPVHEPLHVLKTVPFQLTTQKRAAEREKFDNLLKEKEEELEKLRQLKEKEAEEIEERTKVQLRSKLVHHAKPIPVAVTHPFVPEKSDAPLTVPETPKFVRRLKQNM